MNNLEVVIDTEKRSSLLNKVQILSQPVHAYYVEDCSCGEYL